MRSERQCAAVCGHDSDRKMFLEIFIFVSSRSQFVSDLEAEPNQRYK